MVPPAPSAVVVAVPHAGDRDGDIEWQQWHQVDVAPTIALLLGAASPPANSVGRLISPVVRWLVPDALQRIALYRRNAQQLCHLAAMRLGDPDDAAACCRCDISDDTSSSNDKSACAAHNLWRRAACELANDASSDEVEANYDAYMREVTSQLQEATSAFSLDRLLLCFALAVVCALWAVYASLAGITSSSRPALVTVAGLALWQWVAHPLSLISSSLVEEEQEFWAYTTSTAVIVLSL